MSEVFDNLIQKNNLERYVVDDLNLEQAEIIFVLESPHKKEVEPKERKDRHPAAGTSGKAMTRILFPSREDYLSTSKGSRYLEALGKLIKDKKITNIGIMNVSQLPLQKKVYKSLSNEVIDNLQSFRENKEISESEISQLLFENFKHKIEKYHDKKIVLCGGFVKEIFCQICQISNLKFLNVLEVPHPSYNNWEKELYKHKINKLKDFTQ